MWATQENTQIAVAIREKSVITVMLKGMHTRNSIHLFHLTFTPSANKCTYVWLTWDFLISQKANEKGDGWRSLQLASFCERLKSFLNRFCTLANKLLWLSYAHLKLASIGANEREIEMKRIEQHEKCNVEIKRQLWIEEKEQRMH